MSNIPHIIHYCWFGGKEMPSETLKYIEAWKKILPNWEFICWTEKNFDIDDSIPYVKEAYEQKKYAFVSDYVRLCALYKYGGVYLDTDIEIYRNFEAFLDQIPEDMVVAFESEELIMTAFLACRKGHPIIARFLELYEHLHFVRDNNEYDQTPNTDRLTMLLSEYGLEINNKEQILKKVNVHVFTDDYFSGYNMENSHPKITGNTYTIHHYMSSWKKMSFSTWFKYRIVVRGIQKLIGYDNYDKLKGKLHI